MLLIDEIRNTDPDFYPSNVINDLWGEQGVRSILDFALDLLPYATVFKVDNVMRYALDHISIDEKNPLSIFPTIAPPFPVFWMEYVMPDGELKGTRHGGLFIAYEKDREDMKWEMKLISFSSGYPDRPRTIFGPSVCVGIGITPEGTVHPDMAARMYIPTDADPHDTTARIAADETISAVGWTMVPCLLALSFLNCKNVSTTEHSGLYANRQDRRQAERRGDPPRSTFHTLEIEPMKKVLTTEGGIATNGLKKALHICRGHFSEYGDEYGKGKLFGKLEGRYWMPAHVRGSSEVGIADKDYNVKAPRKDAA